MTQVCTHLPRLIDVATVGLLIGIAVLWTAIGSA